jgi:hypothetical protein|nr:hypothetical protein [uncultured Nocardioides sp.]
MHPRRTRPAGAIALVLVLALLPIGFSGIFATAAADTAPEIRLEAPSSILVGEAAQVRVVNTGGPIATYRWSIWPPHYQWVGIDDGCTPRPIGMPWNPTDTVTIQCPLHAGPGTISVSVSVQGEDGSQAVVSTTITMTAPTSVRATVGSSVGDTPVPAKTPVILSGRVYDEATGIPLRAMMTIQFSDDEGKYWPIADTVTKDSWAFNIETAANDQLWRMSVYGTELMPSYRLRYAPPPLATQPPPPSQPPTSKQGTRVTLKVVAGKQTRFQGVLKRTNGIAVGGKRLALQVRWKGTQAFKTIATGKTGASTGRVILRYKVRKAGAFRYVFAGTSTFAGSTSAVKTVAR